MWPTFHCLSKEECLSNLRQLELEAYSILVSAFRAQGSLTSEKRKILKEVSNVLNIGIDRHKCEVRRVANDEKLKAIASYQGNRSPINDEDWHLEGRRITPVLQRISPRTLHPIHADIVKFPEEKLKIEDQEFNIKREGYKHSGTKPTKIYNRHHEVDIIEKGYSSAKMIINKNQKVMIMKSNAKGIPCNTGILHKAPSVPISKVSKINLEKFKVIPTSISSNLIPNLNTGKIFLSNKTCKKIIPFSQLHMLNHKLTPKGTLKVVPISSKFIAKKITMAHIGNRLGTRTSVLQPLIPSNELSTVNVQKEETKQQHFNEAKMIEEKSYEDVEMKVEERNDFETKIKEGEQKMNEEEVKDSIENNNEDDDLEALMQIDTGEFIESELKETIEGK